MSNCYQISISASKRYTTLVWKNMEAKDLTKTSKRRRSLSQTTVTANVSSVEKNEMETNSGGHLNTSQQAPLDNQPQSSYLGQVLLPSFGSQFTHFQQTASYSTRAHSSFVDSYNVMSSEASTSKVTEDHNEEEGWKTVRTKDKYSYNQTNTREDHNRAKSPKKDYKPHSYKNKADPYGFSSLPRRWEYTDLGLKYEQEGHKQSKKAGLPFSIMSYNILSQNLLEDHMYLYKSCHAEALDWDMRSEKLLAEIQYHSPDIICFQEVQSDHYESFFKNKLFKLGYAGEFFKRSGSKPDGCATFYKLDKFSLLKSTPVEFFKGDILDRDNVALVLELVPNSKLYHGSVKKIGVANTHLLYNPRRGDVKLAQLMVLLAELDKLLHKESDNPRPSYHPLLLCGDLNSEPFSDIYKFLTTGYLHYDGLPARQLSGQYVGSERSTYKKLKKHFFSSNFGITDQCQYVDTAVQRQGVTYNPANWQMEGHACSQSHLSDPLNNGKVLSQESNTVDQIQVANMSTQDASNEIYRPQDQNNPKFSSSSETSNQDKISGCSNQEAEVGNVSDIVHSIFGSGNKQSENQKSAMEIIPRINSNDMQEASISKPQGLESMNENWDADIQKNLELLPQEVEEKLPHFSQASGRLWHNFNLISSYKHRIQRYGYKEYEVTSQHDWESCCVDYIFYSGSCSHRLQGQHAYKEGKLKLLARYGLMSNVEIYNLGGLPNKLLPSDHVCLLTKFLLK